MKKRNKVSIAEVQYTVDDVKRFVNDELARLSGISEIPPKSSLTHDLGLDSLDCVDLTMECEMEFDIAITPDESDEIRTAQDMIDVCVKKLNLV